MQLTFEKAPINEVVLGQVFLPRQDVLVPHFGAFWINALQERYPKCSHAAPVVAPNESPISDSSTGWPLPRVWYISEDDTRLVQLQQDRLYTNWRQSSAGEEYIRFSRIAEEFEVVFSRYQEFITQLSGQPLRTVGYELTYVNIIGKGPEWQSAGDVGLVFTDICWSDRERFLPAPKRVAAKFEFELPNQFGSMVVSIAPAKHRESHEEVFRLELAAAAPAEIVGNVPFAEWVNVAHDYIVYGFKDLTTDAMHKYWGLKGG